MFNDISAHENKVQLDDSSNEVACLVNHLYGGEDYLIDVDNLLPCRRMAHKYDMPRLQRAVDAFAKQIKLTDTNVVHYIGIAFESLLAGNPALFDLAVQCSVYVAWRLERICSAR